MYMNRERMLDNLTDKPDPDLADYCNTAEVRLAVLNNQQKHGKRPFCQDPFKVATACLTALCVLLLVILVATNVHKASAATQCTPRTTKGPCPVDWHYFKGSCYFISDNSESWPESQAYCELKGGHLAIVLTAAEQTFIWDLLPRGYWNAYWIGISDEKTENDWRWVDGTKLVTGFWEDGEPNNDNDEDCGYMIKTLVLSRVAAKSWYDAPCHMSRPFICEKKADVSS